MRRISLLLDPARAESRADPVGGARLARRGVPWPERDQAVHQRGEALGIRRRAAPGGTLAEDGLDDGGDQRRDRQRGQQQQGERDLHRWPASLSLVRARRSLRSSESREEADATRFVKALAGARGHDYRPADDRFLGELRAILDGMQIGFLTTLGAEGYFHSRPMQLQRHDPDGTLWFATSLDSHKCEDLRANPRCCASFLRGSKYVSMSGTAELVKDERLIRSMWTAAWRGWFPEGPKEPDLVLLKVVPESRGVRRSAGRHAAVRSTPA